MKIICPKEVLNLVKNVFEKVLNSIKLKCLTCVDSVSIFDPFNFFLSQHWILYAAGMNSCRETDELL